MEVVIVRRLLYRMGHQAHHRPAVQLLRAPGATAGRRWQIKVAVPLEKHFSHGLSLLLEETDKATGYQNPSAGSQAITSSPWTPASGSPPPGARARCGTCPERPST